MSRFLTDFQHTKLYQFQPWVYVYDILKILQILASIVLQNMFLLKKKRLYKDTVKP